MSFQGKGRRGEHIFPGILIAIGEQFFKGFAVDGIGIHVSLKRAMIIGEW